MKLRYEIIGPFDENWVSFKERKIKVWGQNYCPPGYLGRDYKPVLIKEISLTEAVKLIKEKEIADKGE